MLINNHFKKHSTDDIEQCIAKALSELIGKDVTVEIGELKFSNDKLEIDRGVTFSMRAHHNGLRPRMMGVE